MEPEGSPVANHSCRAGGRFRRCARPPVHTCQYCGRPFCEAHSYFAEGYDAVCIRGRCRAKHDDLQRHEAYRLRVSERNRAGLCGVEGCGPHPGLECSLCRGHFCARHISDRQYPIREGYVIINRPASVCPWCWDRRKVWKR